MQSEDEDIPKRAALIVVFGVVAAVVVGVVAYGAAHRGAATSPSTVLATATAMVKRTAAEPVKRPAVDASAAAFAASDAASIKVENGVVKFYFAPEKAELPEGASEALANLVKQAKDGVTAGRKLLVSGFHDATGDAAKNVELAKQRAIAVRDALTVAGVSASQIEMKKPEQTQVGGVDAEARRVEVTMQ